jgi:hypothetical protein
MIMQASPRKQLFMVFNAHLANQEVIAGLPDAQEKAFTMSDGCKVRSARVWPSQKLADSILFSMFR